MNYLKTKEFDDSISQILDNLNVSTINRTDEIDILYKQQQQYFINLTQFRSETVFPTLGQTVSLYRPEKLSQFGRLWSISQIATLVHILAKCLLD